MGVVLVYVIPNGVEQVSFAQSGRTVNEQRVIRTTRGFGNTLSSRKGELVRGALYEGFEGVARVEPHCHAFARATFEGGGFGGLGKRSVELGRQLVGGVVRGQLLVDIGSSVGLDVDEQLALTCPNFV